MLVYLIVATAVSLPFLLVRDDDVRKRIYRPLCFAPVLLPALMYLGGFGAYFILILGMSFVIPLSLTLIIIGITLAVHAYSSGEECGGLAMSALLASSPLILFIGLLIGSMLSGG
jgi:hypothetical protein